MSDELPRGPRGPRMSHDFEERMRRGLSTMAVRERVRERRRNRAIAGGAVAAAVVAVPGEVKGGRLVAALQRGSQGAPVLDATGALVGLVMGRPDEARAVAGLIPPAGYDLTTSAALSAAVTAAGATIDPATSGEPTPTGRLVAGWAGRIVAVECRR